MTRTLILLALAAGLTLPGAFAQSTTPKVVKKIPVEFPPDAVRKGVDRGVFKARLTIDGEGNVTDSSIVEATPAKAKMLNASVLESLGKWRFESAGKPATFEMQVVLTAD
ncbi:MAG TPA: TonB family protein [Burkholderiaceae bacterium]|nr:TonB family protein [Burkholderiaceae bacterium]